MVDVNGGGDVVRCFTEVDVCGGRECQELLMPTGGAAGEVEVGNGVAGRFGKCDCLMAFEAV